MNNTAQKSFLSGFVFLFVFAHFGHHVVSALLPPLLPLISKDFSLSNAEAGLLISAYNLAYGISQLPAGWLADRLGARLLITIGISGVAVTGVLAGIAPGYVIMAGFLALMGILGGGYHPSASPLVSASVSEKNRGKALGLHQIGGTLSNFLSPLLAVWIANLLGGWRGSFISISLVILIFGITFYIILGRVQQPAPSKPESSSRPETDERSGKAVYSRLIPFIIIGVILQVVTFSVLSFIPKYAVDGLQTTKETGAAFLAIAQFAGLWAGPLGGHFSDRFGNIPVMLAVALTAGPAIFLIGNTALGWSIWVLLLVLGACQYVGMPVSEVYVISHSPARTRSTILGIYYFASRGGPGLFMPALGYLADTYSFGTAFTIAGGALLAIVLICSIFLWGKKD